MKFREVYFLCKKNRSVIRKVSMQKSPNSSGGKSCSFRVLNDMKNVKEALNQLTKIECLHYTCKQILETIPDSDLDSIELETKKAHEYMDLQSKLMISIDSIIGLYESTGVDTNEIEGLDIKLPTCNDFSELKKYISELEFILTKCPFFQNEKESLHFKCVDVGSTWLTFAVAGAIGSSILLNNIAAFIDKCMVIRSHYLTTQKQKNDIEKEKIDQSEKETICKYIDMVYKRQVDEAVRELEEISNYKIQDGDEKGRVEQSLEKLGKLIDKGLEIYSTIDSPQETKALFEPLEMKYIAANNQLKLLVKDDESENNNGI